MSESLLQRLSREIKGDTVSFWDLHWINKIGLMIAMSIVIILIIAVIGFVCTILAESANYGHSVALAIIDKLF